ncbi:tyrosine-type recombinase/integrase [Mycolicibacterium wolinskyi]|uniref:tyrosine-type recombinase/integrase n=1 Tax=Mycolicibacterium wolinskyi TaxID=59750 RepID=UPI0039176FED
MVFRDPTRGIRLGSVLTLRTELHDDKLRGLIERGESSLERAILALVAIHAVQAREIRSLGVRDVDFARSTVKVVRPHLPERIIHLDELTSRLLTEWIRGRNRQWPTTENDYLFMSANGAFSIQRPPVGASKINAIFRRLGLTPRQVRIDRILHEARVAADLVHLMQVFGISVTTAVTTSKRPIPNAADL